MCAVDIAITGAARGPSRAVEIGGGSEPFRGLPEFDTAALGIGDPSELPVEGLDRSARDHNIFGPELPEQVGTVTLSYTFYLNEIATRRVATAAAPTAPAS